MIREIVLYGHPVLRQKGARVTETGEAIKQLAADMLDTMREAHGVGLAAQQVGVPLQLAVIDVTGVEDRPSTMAVDGQEVELAKWMPLVLLNPMLELGKEKLAGPEGCLSFPEMTAEISRALRVVARAQLLDGRHVQFEATGLLGRALQHEFDHLQGILFIDRMSSAAKASLAGKLKRLQREAGLR
ncbi:MAG: peptide deformylase [Verrucomicrobiota bacterium]|nr:peptide deformylase [Verrucomicrobiota bacterium]